MPVLRVIVASQRRGHGFPQLAKVGRISDRTWPDTRLAPLGSTPQTGLVAPLLARRSLIVGRPTNGRERSARNQTECNEGECVVWCRSRFPHTARLELRAIFGNLEYAGQVERFTKTQTQRISCGISQYPGRPAKQKNTKMGVCNARVLSLDVLQGRVREEWSGRSSEISGRLAAFTKRGVTPRYCGTNGPNSRITTTHTPPGWAVHPAEGRPGKT